MIEHVYKRVAMCKSLAATYVAACDEEVMRATESFGGEAIMTSTRHQRASDRVAEAAESLDADVVVMVQGDEPMTTPEMVDLAISPMAADPEIGCVNLAKRIQTEEELEDRNTIKIVMDRKRDALYFSREAIPTRHISSFQDVPVFKQVCIIPFRRRVLLEYAELDPTPLEIAESVDMVRFLEHGYKVRLVETEHESHAVDSAADLALVEELMRKDPLVERY